MYSKVFIWQYFFWFQLESDYQKYKKDAENEIEKLTAKNAANSESEDLPWETDPELRDMTAVELRAILADDLTGILLFFFREIKFLFTIMFFRERSVTKRFFISQNTKKPN